MRCIGAFQKHCHSIVFEFLETIINLQRDTK